MALESWNWLEGGLLSRSLNRIKSAGLSVRSESEEADTPPLRLDRVKGFLRWRRFVTGWQLEVKDLAQLHDRTRLPIPDLELRFAAGKDGGWTIMGGSRFLDLADNPGPARAAVAVSTRDAWPIRCNPPQWKASQPAVPPRAPARAAPALDCLRPRGGFESRRPWAFPRCPGSSTELAATERGATGLLQRRSGPGSAPPVPSSAQVRYGDRGGPLAPGNRQ